MPDLLALVSFFEHDCIMWYLLAVSLSWFESYQCTGLVIVVVNVVAVAVVVYIEQLS